MVSTLAIASTISTDLIRHDAMQIRIANDDDVVQINKNQVIARIFNAFINDLRRWRRHWYPLWPSQAPCVWI